MDQAAPAIRASNGAFAAATGSLVDAFRAQRPLRAGSLIITVFGDAIAVHGGTVWLGSLINALEGFGINQRLVRTSVYRLVQDGWLSTEQIGRRSYYSLTDSGRQRFAEASRRIYSDPRHDWPGTWCLVLLAALDASERDSLKKELGWLGFAAFSTNLLAHPDPDRDAFAEHLEQSGLRDKVLVMDARISDERQQAQLARQVAAAWPLDELAGRYAAFLARFRPIYAAARRQKRDLDPAEAFRVRTLMIHEYRKILLRDPQLPAELLPRRWDGDKAGQLCRNLYTLLAGATERYLQQQLESADGPLPPADASYFDRFGGLPAFED